MTVASARINVLFLSAGNAMRSILAEAMLNRIAPSRFRAFSAGSSPVYRVDPQALSFLAALGYETQGLRSKCWAEFIAPSAHRMDAIILMGGHTLRAVWPGAPVLLEWPVPPLSEIDRPRTLYGLLEDRITRFIRQPFRLGVRGDEVQTAPRVA